MTFKKLVKDIIYRSIISNNYTKLFYNAIIVKD